jgi:thiol-disulfide isomerase/thioredoxin
MREFVRFVALSLSVLALPLFAADLRMASDPAKIDAVFPAAAKLRVLNVWATWCAPCVEEMPDLRAIDEAFGGELAIVGVSLDDMLPDAKPEKVRSFLTAQKIAFPNIYYTGQPDALGDHLDFSGGVPLTIVYDRKGRELWRVEGRLERGPAITRLRELLRRIK